MNSFFFIDVLKLRNLHKIELISLVSERLIFRANIHKSDIKCGNYIVDVV